MVTIVVLLFVISTDGSTVRPPRSAPPEPPQSAVVPLESQEDLDWPITFVHVGKAGGSSLACKFALTERMDRARYPCPGVERDVGALNSRVSLLVKGWVHTSVWRVPPKGPHTNILLVVRNPIERVASSFAYHLCENKHPCSDHLDDIVPLGLGALPELSTTALLKLWANATARKKSSETAANASASECEAFGVRCIAGQATPRQAQRQRRKQKYLWKQGIC